MNGIGMGLAQNNPDIQSYVRLMYTLKMKMNLNIWGC